VARRPEYKHGVLGLTAICGLQRRLGSIALLVLSAAAGAWLLRFGVAAPLLAASLNFTLALWPLMHGRAEG
jgi:hypothetical protein